MGRNVDLSERRVENRDRRDVNVIQFELNEIIGHFQDNVQIIKDMKNFTMVPENSNERSIEQILKAQIVFLVSAFDFFMHEVMKYGLVKIYDGNWEKTERYYNIMIPMRILDGVFHNEADENWFLNFMNKKLSTETIVSFEQIKDAFNQLGLDVGELADRVYYDRESVENTKDKLKRRLNELFSRRNHIAHQSDRRHSDAEILSITEAEVEGFVIEIEKIVSGVKELINNK